jgi:hypothetical protein
MDEIQLDIKYWLEGLIMARLETKNYYKHWKGFSPTNLSIGNNFLATITEWLRWALLKGHWTTDRYGFPCFDYESLIVCTEHKHKLARDCSCNRWKPDSQMHPHLDHERTYIIPQ